MIMMCGLLFLFWDVHEFVTMILKMSEGCVMLYWWFKKKNLIECNNVREVLFSFVNNVNLITLHVVFVLNKMDEV